VNERVVIVGGGGHAKVLVDILEQTAEVEIAGFVSTNEQDSLFGYRRLGNDGVLPALFASGVRSALVAIGDNRRRLSAIETLANSGFRLINAISSAAVISRHVRLGQAIAVLPGAIVNADSQLGDGVIINTNASVDHDCFLAACVHVAPGSSVAGGVRLEEGVFLGTGSSVIPGVTIGSWTIVGAGAVVVSDLPPNIVAVGVPAIPAKANRTS